MIKRARFDGDAFYPGLGRGEASAPMHLEASSRGERNQCLHFDSHLSGEAPGR